jgi:predicted RNA methylase
LRIGSELPESIQSYFLGSGNLQVAVVGTYDEEDIGVSCYHANLSILEIMLSHMTDQDAYVVVDMVAGVDAFANTLHAQFDALVLAVEPTQRGVEVFRQYSGLAQAAGVLDRLLVVGNKVRGEEDAVFLATAIPQKHFIGSMQDSNYLRKKDREGGNAKNSIAEWIQDYNNFIIKSKSSNSLEDYFKIKDKFKELSGKDMEIIKEIIFIFDELKTGKIWRDITQFRCAHKKSDHKESFDPNQHYLQRLSEIKNIDFWLQDYMVVADWLVGKPGSFLKDLFSILKKKIDLSKEEQIQNLLNLSEQLKNKKIIKDDVIFFNESDNQFHWNEDFFKH